MHSHERLLVIIIITIINYYYGIVSYRDDASLSHYDLHIKSVSVEDEGRYTCVDEAGMGVSASATLSVLPHVVTHYQPPISLLHTATSTTSRFLSTAQHPGAHIDTHTKLQAN